MHKHYDHSQDQSKNNQNQLSKAISQLQAFTHGLQSKVDGILKAQETEFVTSYKVHMQKVKLQFDNLTNQLKKKQEIIDEYENQGKMAYLIKRVDFLEAEEKKLLTDLQRKKNELRNAALQNSIRKSQNKRLQQKIKDLLKERASREEVKQREHNASYESIQTFPTQIGQHQSKKALSKMMTQQKSLKMHSLHQRSQVSINPQQLADPSRLQRQITILKKQNRQLISFNSRYVSEASSMEKFFIEVVNQIKKNIAARKDIKQCSLEDFRKEDKLELMIKILSNDELTYRLHSIIFGSKTVAASSVSTYNNVKDMRIQRPSSLRSKMNVRRSAEYHFPSINSARLS